jgi:D-amino-acid dehydrogenase
MKRIAIVGGGVIGLSTAYYLQKAGHRVVVFDGSSMDNTCSVGNAGMIVPSHIIPLAAPGMVSKGIRWMFNAKSPFYVKPRLNTDLLKWGVKFYRHANKEHVARAIPALKEISLLSKGLFQDMARSRTFDFGYHERGLMMYYRTAETEREEIEAAHIANAHGIEARILTPSEFQKMEPDVKVEARGAVYFPGDAHLTPQLLIKNLISHLAEKGVTIRSGVKVDDFVVHGNAITAIRTLDEEQSFDEYIVATGAWSGQFCGKLGLDLPMQSGKGYSFTLHDVKQNIRIPSLLLEGRVAVTPMGASLRFGGTMEINGTDRSINMNRVKGIVETIPKYFPEMRVAVPTVTEVWNGLRPCSPDGLPYIGRVNKFRNLIIATGHAMMGLSLGPATGMLVTELINETKPSMDLKPFDPQRFMK